MAKQPENKIIVVGGGLSGLMATMKICEGGGKVDLFSYCPVKRSHSLCAQGGINACMDTKGEHDSIMSILMIRSMAATSSLTSSL